MLVVEKHIKALLFENDYVIVPAFGGFITHYVQAEVNKVKNLISPPSKQIAFNSLLKQNDWLLVSSIVAAENITREEAVKLIDAYVANIMNEINNARYYNFEELGIFSLNREYQIYFEPYHKINYLSNSFGLPEVAAKTLRKTPITLSNAKDRLPEELGKNKQQGKKLVKFGVYVFSVLILGCTSTVFLYVNKGNKEMSSFNPFYTNTTNHVLIDSTDLPNPDLLYKKPNIALEETPKQDTVVAAPIVEEKVEEVVKVEIEVKEPVLHKAEVVKSEVKSEFLEAKTGKAYIIVGGFTVKENALQMQKIIKNEGLQSNVIAPDASNKMYRVTLGEFDSNEIAKRKAEEYKSTYGNSIWVLQY